MTMNKKTASFSAALLTAVLATSQPALAQSRSTSDNGYSLLPYTNSGYVGLSLGTTDFKTRCGANPALTCDDSKGAFHLFTGGLANPYWGVELGYVHSGNAKRGGGETRAQGLHLSVLGRVPLGNSFSLHAKLGALYGRTRTSAVASSAIPTGSESGWGPTYGLGASLELNRNWSVLLEQNRYEFHFAGVGRESVDVLSLGVNYRF